MPRSTKSTGQYGTTGQYGGFGDANYGMYNSGRSDNNSYMNNGRSYNGGFSNSSYNNDYNAGGRYNQGSNTYGGRYSSNLGIDNQFGSDYSSSMDDDRYSRTLGRNRDTEGRWLDRGDMQRNRYYGPDDRSYSNRYGRGMYANRDERYDDEEDDIRDVRLDSNYSTNYDEIGHEGNEDTEDVDSNYDALYGRNERDYNFSSDWSGRPETYGQDGRFRR